MKIKILQEILASADETGTKIKSYKKNEVYDIYEELAEIFVKQGWGEEIKLETQEEEIKLETQEEEIKLETQEEEMELKTQDLKLVKKNKNANK